jgi:hypothetical protein
MVVSPRYRSGQLSLDRALAIRHIDHVALGLNGHLLQGFGVWEAQPGLPVNGTILPWLSSGG